LIPISVIIPTLDEAERIVGLIDHLRSIDPTMEIIVADGGSADGTPEVARGADRVIHGPRGRAAQMNAGASAATGDVLWFVHADCLPHQSSAAEVRRAMRDPRIAGGAFEFSLDSPGIFFRVTEAVSNRKNRIAGLFFGDMGIFVRSEVFRRMGGYRDLPLMEDVDLCRRLRCEGRAVILRPRIATSTRRWKAEGRLYNLVRNWVVLGAWVAGVSPERLLKHYAFPKSGPVRGGQGRMERQS
jgi:rSAM/selenodomain-associated transferase 2